MHTYTRAYKSAVQMALTVEMHIWRFSGQSVEFIATTHNSNNYSSNKSKSNCAVDKMAKCNVKCVINREFSRFIFKC